LKIFEHNVFEPWPLVDQSVQAIISSPPYWCIRQYDIPDVIIGGDPDCKHRFKTVKRKNTSNFKKSTVKHHRISCKTGFCRCRAWLGQHGLEPTVKQFIDNALIWTAEAQRVLMDDGVMFINLGDTYGGSNSLTSASEIRQKSLALIPQRFAIALYDQGWYVRDIIIWEKPNGIPESVQDRPARRYEVVMMFTKEPKYYFDLDALRVPYQPDSYRRFKDGYKPQNIPQEALPGRQQPHQRSYAMNPLGANPGNVWRISINRLPGLAHYAIFPLELAEKLVKCSSRPDDTVLDPFMGSGTTAEACLNLGRYAIGFDLGYEEVRRDRLKLFYPQGATN